MKEQISLLFCQIELEEGLYLDINPNFPKGESLTEPEVFDLLLKYWRKAHPKFNSFECKSKTSLNIFTYLNAFDSYKKAESEYTGVYLSKEKIKIKTFVLADIMPEIILS